MNQGALQAVQPHAVMRNGVLHRHHRKNLRLADVGVAKGVPDHQILVLDIAIVLRVSREADTPILVGVIARAVTLVGWVRRHPQMLAGKPAASAKRAV